MKKLILPFLFLSFTVLGANEMPTKNETNQIVTTIKDLEVKDLLSKTSEFKKCRDDNPFKPGASDAERNASLLAAEKCFKDQLGKGSNSEKKLKELSHNLGLQNYGLVKGNNITAIQEYLNDKMYESMTGVSRKDAGTKKFIEDMKFGKKKHIDQKTFITLYTAQLNKNILFEVSRYCFEDLRSDSATAPKSNIFGDHWKNFETDFQNKTVTDDGNPKFGNITGATDKAQIYKEIFESLKIGKGGFDTAKLSDFFINCGQMINHLCEEFKNKNSSVTNADSDVKVGIITTPTTPATTTGTVATSTTKGAASCLAKAKLLEIRTALANSEKIIEIFDKEMQANPKKMASVLTEGTPVKIYGIGNNPGEESIDNLTNYTSKDIIEGGLSDSDKAKNKTDTCNDNPEYDNCKDFFQDGESLDKVKHKVEMEMTLKREVELARVRKLKDEDQASLEKYLTDNGYFEILNNYKDPKINNSPDWLEKQIKLEFDAKKVATLNAINTKLGKRQVAKDADSTVVKTAADEIIKTSKEERTRLGQVVLFNNIITSYLALKKKDENGKEQDMGRNLNAWTKEQKALEGASVDSQLFQGLKTTGKDADSTSKVGQNDQLGGVEMINKILGEKNP